MESIRRIILCINRVCVCVRVRIYIYIYIYIYVCVCMCLCICTCVCVYERVGVYLNFFDHKDLGNHLLQ